MRFEIIKIFILKGKKKMGLPRATLEQKIKVLDWYYLNGTKSQQYTVNYFISQNEFSITKSSFNRWLKDEDELRSMFQKINVNNRGVYKTRPNLKNYLIDKCLEKWVYQKLLMNESVSERVLIYQWRLFNELVGNVDNNVGKSNGWVYHFKQKIMTTKNLIIDYLKMIESMPKNFHDEKTRLQNLFENVPISDIYQFDEIVLNPRITPLENESSSMRFIVGVCCNGDGSDWFEPLIINNHDLKRDGYYQSNINMITNEIFLQYLTKLENSIEKKIYLLIDCHYEHFINLENFKKIHIVWFNPNFQTRYSILSPSAKLVSDFEELQFLNLGVVRQFKLIFKNMCFKQYLYGLITLNKLINLTPVQVYEIIQSSFQDLKMNHKGLVLQCFENSGILPINQDSKKKQVFDKILESSFIKLLTEFSKYGINIFTHNYSIDHILFPPDEFVVNKSYSESEIVALVKLEDKKLESQSVHPSLIQRVDSMELSNMDKLINVELRQFFAKYGDALQKSSEEFNKFLNVFINESMDIKMNQDELIFQDENILPDLLNN